ncbi:uncharacterized protein [Primulina eburnea]|uniref:uncharacterized protein isoform X5 n=1 Tax=Primulina eburnea TaxID=1245227 RepID=UPI003C6C9A05
MAFPRSHPPHSGWDKFHGLTKINTRAQLPLVNIQRHPGIKVLGARRFLCGLIEVRVTGHSELGNLVISMVFHGFFWCYQVCIGSIRDGNWIVHHLRMERIVDAYFTSKCDFRYHCSRRCESLSFGTRLSFHAISIDIPWRIVRVSNG